MQVWDARRELEDHGARVLIVGQGSGAQAEEFCKRMGATFSCLGDPDRQAYAALGLDRASWWTVTLGSLLANPWAGLRRLARADLRASMDPRSDVLQLGGVLVVDRGGTIRYLHRATEPADLPTTSALLAALA